MTTNDKFDEQFFDNWPGVDYGELKTFISQEKNLLLDQAIEELGKMENINTEFDKEVMIAEIPPQLLKDLESTERGWKLAISEAISKLKELKE